MGTKYVRSDIEVTAAGAAGIELTTASTGLTDVYIYGGVNVTSSYDDGIRGIGSEHDALIGGYIIGDINGVRLGDNRSTDHDNRVFIYSGGTVVGINNAGVAVNGYNSIVSVEGEIQGDVYGVLMSGVTTKFKSSVINDGEIYANSYAVAHSLSGGDTEGLLLRNTGHIEGGLFSFYGGDNNLAADRIVNGGAMVGDVSMGGGNDVYDARQGGSVDGSVYGGIGDDRFVGNSRADDFVGGAGNDRLDGGRGFDTLTGGLGDDTYVINNTYYDTNPDPDAEVTSYGDVIVEQKGEGTDTVLANFGFDLALYENVENGTLTAAPRGGNVTWLLWGNELSNTITGNDNANVIDGREGADQLVGLGGNDTYVVDNIADKVIEKGGGGTDLVQASVTYSLSGLQVENITLTGVDSINATGNTMDNTINGNNGNNVITGGGGSDTINLGSYYLDSDTIVFSSALSSTNVDTISQFSGSSGDTIQLKSSIFSALSLGTISASAFQFGYSDIAQNSDVRIIYNASSQSLLYDSDGSGAASAVVFAKLISGNVSADDFFVV